MKKHWILIVCTGTAVLAMLLLVANYLFGPIFRGRLPTYPNAVSNPGQYWISDNRFVQVIEMGGLVYQEGVSINQSSKYKGLVTSSIELVRTIPDVRLVTGWRIGLEPCDTIMIELGDGKIYRRKFGDLPKSFVSTLEDQGEVNEKAIDLLESFGKIKAAQHAAQPGAGQPAIRPADKPPVKDQPSPPTPKDAPR